jgi:hypothetical protein
MEIEVKELDNNRSILEQGQKIYKELLEGFEKDNENLINSLKHQKEKIKSLEDDIREQAINKYNNDKSNKKLFGGIGIRIGSLLKYDNKEAFDWAKEHSLCLSLDKKEFEKIAKTQDMEFVQKEEKITVTFPKKIEF